jgi:deoxyribodipyrimidine photo-lyase
MKQEIAVYWSRRDFRLRDNPALAAAVHHAKEKNIPLLPLFILEEYMCAGDPHEQFGYPSRVFLSRALPEFAKQFEHFALVRGRAAETLMHLGEKVDITIFVNEDIHPDFFTQIKKIKDAGITIKLYADMLTVDKETKTGSGNYYSVFTPFKKAVWQSFIEAPVLRKVSYTDISFVSPQDIHSWFSKTVIPKESEIIQCFSDKKTFLAGGQEYDSGVLIDRRMDIDSWYVSEDEALSRFEYYLENHMDQYKDERDSLEKNKTSRMSLGLAWGLVSARLLRQKIQKHFGDSFDNPFSTRVSQGAVHYISELIWREFYKYLFFHNPRLMNQEFQERFRGTVEWITPASRAHERFVAWMKGRTGYPIVDAAMMELAQTGWMHNRARMIVASVLTKNLGVDWRWGQEYFRAMLVDLDEASNNGGWQWGASVGADPKPIRIFNPYLQAKNYDTNGVYQKKYLTDEYLKNPPSPLVEHTDARSEALKRYHLNEKHDGHARDY